MRARNLKDEEINLAINSTRVLALRAGRVRRRMCAPDIILRAQEPVPLVLDLHDEELRRLVLTGVSTDCMNDPRSFIESLPPVQGLRPFHPSPASQSTPQERIRELGSCADAWAAR